MVQLEHLHYANVKVNWKKRERKTADVCTTIPFLGLYKTEMYTCEHLKTYIKISIAV